MAIRALADLDLTGKRTFIRVDFNVPLNKQQEVTDDSRIRAAVPTIKYCLERDAKVILASHLGRPKGKKVPELSMEPVAIRLAEILEQEIFMADEPAGDGARKVVNDLREGQVALLENLRWHAGETSNDDTFAKQLAGYADVYVNDAFGTAHRAHASTVGMTHFVKERAAGFLMLQEVRALSKLMGEVDRPFVAILGGAKVSDKIGVIENLLSKVNVLIIGGAMAYTFLKAEGGQVGASRVEADRLTTAREILKNSRLRNIKIMLPTDHVVASSLEAQASHKNVGEEIPSEWIGVDIGPRTRDRFAAEILGAGTVFWNGPMGIFEMEPYAGGTFRVAEAVAGSSAFSVVGGGDSVSAVRKSGFEQQISHISTGGGASLEFLEGIQLPGLAALEV